MRTKIDHSILETEDYRNLHNEIKTFLRNGNSKLFITQQFLPRHIETFSIEKLYTYKDKTILTMDYTYNNNLIETQLDCPISVGEIEWHNEMTPQQMALILTRTIQMLWERAEKERL